MTISLMSILQIVIPILVPIACGLLMVWKKQGELEQLVKLNYTHTEDQLERLDKRLTRTEGFIDTIYKQGCMCIPERKT